MDSRHKAQPLRQPDPQQRNDIKITLHSWLLLLYLFSPLKIVIVSTILPFLKKKLGTK